MTKRISDDSSPPVDDESTKSTHTEDNKSGDGKGQGEGVDLTSPAESKSPKMPHERDERVGMTDGTPSKRVQQGARDLKRGVQDTSRATESDTAYRNLKK